jgi:hypothetical protein
MTAKTETVPSKQEGIVHVRTWYILVIPYQLTVRLENLFVEILLCGRASRAVWGDEDKV